MCVREREGGGGERERERGRESGSTCVTPGERLRQSLRKQTKNEVARRGLDGKKIPKSNFKVYSLEEKLLISFS